MEWVALVLLLLFYVVGFVCNFFTGIGTLIILVGAILFAVMTGWSVFSLNTLLVLGVLVACGEAFEFVSSVVGTKRIGGSSASAVGGVVGGLLGAGLGLFAFGVGAFMGLALGLFLGTALVEWAIKRDVRQAVKAGLGGLLGRMAAIAVKVVIALTMLVIMAHRVWTHWSTLT